MAMEKQYVVRDTHSRPITALGYNPTRREILMGCEDGVIKMWKADTGKLSQKTHEHKGWVTDFLFWPDAKIVLSSSVDGYIICWGPGGALFDSVRIGVPVYCMTINPRRMQLLCGVNAAIKVYDLTIDSKTHHYINNKAVFTATDHTDIVRCIVCHEWRVYSAGYDQRLIIYDSPITGEDALTPIHINNHAHKDGISCLQIVKDNENNTWILTGSFDRTLKIWTVEGKLVHPPLKNFVTTITGVCFVRQNNTIWAAGGTAYASLYDPKSGDNVSDIIGTFTAETEKYQLQILKFFSEQNQVVASTSRRHLVVWKFNSNGCITVLRCRTAVSGLAYTKKAPLLIFSGDTDGIITKWERVDSNHFMYSKEQYPLSDTNIVKQRKKPASDGSDRPSLYYRKKARQIVSPYAFNKSSMITECSQNDTKTEIFKVIFLDEQDLIIAACEDGNIYVWGFAGMYTEELKDMKNPNMDSIVHKYAVLLDPKSRLLPGNENIMSDEEGVPGRGTEFVCKHIFSEHNSCVTSLIVIPFEGKTYVLSAGWDTKICIWDLEAATIQDIFINEATNGTLNDIELAPDGVISSMAYSPQRQVFGYTYDKFVYIRNFSPVAYEMGLDCELAGHLAEVTCVQWNNTTETWVTGSADDTIRIWKISDTVECLYILDTPNSVTALSIDVVNGAIIAGIQDLIRVYEPDQYSIVQTNVGHTEGIRAILHIPERHQYVTSSWDKTIRVWKAWTLKPPKKKKEETDTKTPKQQFQFDIQSVGSHTKDEDLESVSEITGSISNKSMYTHSQNETRAGTTMTMKE